MKKISKILVTGCAGFIGSEFSKKMLKKYRVIGLDNLDDYYSVKLKRKRLQILNKNRNFNFIKVDIRNYKKLNRIVKKHDFHYVYHFAAQAGVRYSKINPKKYTSTNITGTLNLLNCLKNKKIKKIFLASSSSVYGESNNFPLKEKEKLKPKNHYAYTKKINEITGRSFSKIYKLKIYMLRFFTVYGEWGRPDMFYFKLFKTMFSKKNFELNNNGNHDRDFTHIDDVCEILEKITKKRIKKDFDIFNICSNKPVNIKKILYFVDKEILKVKFKFISRNILDVKKTHGCNKKILKIVGKKKFKNCYNSTLKLFNWYKKNKIYQY